MGSSLDTLSAKLSSTFHLLEQDTDCLLFNTETLQLFRISPEAQQLLVPVLGNDDLDDEWTEEHEPALKEVSQLLLAERPAPAPSSETDQEPALERLVLHISNRCNLQCRYCYAAGGTYGQPKSAMAGDIALKTLDYFYQVYGSINNIQFFGGEPLLNSEVLELVCRYLLKKHKSSEIAALPALSVVTNGTILSPKIVEIISAFNVKVTVSLDGPEQIHDHLRGPGTFARIARNVQTLRRGDIQVGVECTLTRYHLEHDFDVVALMQFFYDEFGLHTTHIPFVSVAPDDALSIPSDELKDSYARAIQVAYRGLDTEDYKLESYGFRLLRSLIFKKKTQLYCPAGATTLAVSSTGEIYPCFIFTGNQELSLGNAAKKRVNQRRLYEISRLIKAANKWQDPECLACWARGLCFGCLGNDYIVTGILGQKSQCDFNKHVITTALRNASPVLENPQSILRIAQLSETKP